MMLSVLGTVQVVHHVRWSSSQMEGGQPAAGQGLNRAQAFDALNAVGLTPTVDETTERYGQAFRLTPQARAVIEVLAQNSRRGHLRGHTQEDLASRTSSAASTVSEVVDRLRRLGIIETSGGEYQPRKHRRSILEYRLRWSRAMWLTDNRWHQARIAAEAYGAGLPPQHIRDCLLRGAAGESDLRAELVEAQAITPAAAGHKTILRD